jgi:uncharacterized protein
MNELFEAIQAGDVKGVRALLVERPALLQARQPDGATPILFAKYVNQSAVLDELVLASGRLSAFEAAALGSLPALERALADDPTLLQSFSDDGWTVLHLACFFGQETCVRWLLARGADPDATSRNALRNRPLHAAAAGRHNAVCAELLRRGAHTDAQQKGGYTALHSAAQHGDAVLVEMLLSAGASPGLADGQGKDAAQHAEDKGHRGLSDRLRTARAS